MALVIALAAVGVIISLVGGVWLVILAFRQSLLWGLATVFIPFAALVFAVMFWDEAKRPFFISIAGSAVATLAAFLAVGAGVHRLAGDMVEIGESDWQAGGDSAFVAPTAVPTLPAPESTVPDATVEDDVAVIFESTAVPSPTPRPTRTPTPVVEATEEWTMSDQLEAKLGELVKLQLRTGQVVNVYIAEVRDGRVGVRQRVGGGTVTYTIAVDEIARIRER